MNLKYHHWILIFLAFALAVLPLSQSNAQNSDASAKKDAAETVSYRFKNGDTLLALAAKYFRRQSDYRAVQKLNRIADPRRIRVGTVIQIPYSVLKFRNENANVAAFRGIVRVAGLGPSAREPVLNETISEGVGLATGPDSSLSLSTSDGSVVTMPSNSAMRIVKLRRILLNGSIDIEYALDQGGVRTIVRPARTPDDRYRVRTPSAVSAVRGTDFRNRYDPEQNRSFAELIEGGLQVDTSAGENAALKPGFGAAISPQGLATEALLPPPAIKAGQGTQREEQVEFALDPVANATGYRLLVARDSGFIDIVAEARSESPSLALAALENGNYFVKFTAFSQAGLEGLPAQQAFRRRLNNVSAEAQQEDDGFTFRWTAGGEERKLYRFQIFVADATSDEFSPNAAPPLVDEAALTQTRLSLSALPAGKYFWRVGTYLYADGELDANWTDFELFTIEPDQ